MEKFSKWRDPGSGIQPFLPIKRTTEGDSSQIYLILNDYLVGPVLGTLKLLILIPILTVWFTIIWILMGIGVPFPVLRVFDTFFGGISLILMGFYSFTRRRMIIRPAIAAVARPFESFSLHTERASQTATIAGDTVQPGDWILSNLTSYCDLILNWFTYSGVITILSDTQSGTIQPCPNRFQVFYHYTLGTLNLNSKSNGNVDDNVNNFRGYPLIIFPEGTTSNGRGVLKFIANMSSAKRNQRIHLTCTKYQQSSTAFPGPPTFQSLLFHLWHLCSQLSNNFTSRTILPAALFSSNFDLPVANENPFQFNRTLQQIIGALGHLRPLNLGAEDKISFLKAFNEAKTN